MFEGVTVLDEHSASCAGRHPTLTSELWTTAPEPSPEHEAFRSSVKQWLEREIAPHSLEWDRAGIFPREIFKGVSRLV